MEWQPIETAPAGESVIVWNGEEVVAASHVHSYLWRTDFARGDYENGDYMYPQPTHWMPMPEPPKEEVK